MAIQSVQAFLNGQWYTLTYNGSTGKYEATVTAPGATSWNLANGVYPMQIKAINTANTTKIVDTTDATVGNALKLRVKETVAPTIAITSPGAGSYVINNAQPIVFQLRDEAGGSGIALASLVLKIDGGVNITSGSAGMVCNVVTNGYDCTYTPQVALSDGAHTVTINVSDNDGNAATQASRSYTVDTVAPTLNVTAPSNSFITNAAAVNVVGSTNDATSSPVTVTVKLNTVDQGAVVVTSGNFSKSINLAEGANTIVIRSTDAAGKYTETTITGTLDTSIPAITSVTLTPNPANTSQSMLIQVAVNG